uniref:TLC domain-containing protein 2 isoform X1 n=1 Tax=Pogona vitticeps TaxID=103695 RepID=A0ABM5ENV0_9SAUR
MRGLGTAGAGGARRAPRAGRGPAEVAGTRTGSLRAWWRRPGGETSGRPRDLRRRGCAGGGIPGAGWEQRLSPEGRHRGSPGGPGRGPARRETLSLSLSLSLRSRDPPAAPRAPDTHPRPFPEQIPPPPPPPALSDSLPFLCRLAEYPVGGREGGTAPGGRAPIQAVSASGARPPARLPPSKALSLPPARAAPVRPPPEVEGVGAAPRGGGVEVPGPPAAFVPLLSLPRRPGKPGEGRGSRAPPGGREREAGAGRPRPPGGPLGEPHLPTLPRGCEFESRRHARFCLHPQMAQDLIDAHRPAAHHLLGISIGYFMHDFGDMICHQKVQQCWELLFHHSVVIVCFGFAFLVHRFVGFAMVALLVEINSVFLHLRTILLMAGLAHTTSYRLTSLVNLGTYVVFRITTLAWMTRWLVLNREQISAATYALSTVGMAIMTPMNIVLFYRLLRNDFLTVSHCQDK